MARTKQLSVDDIIAYDYEGEAIEEMPYFLYEVEYWKTDLHHCAYILKSQFIKSETELDIERSTLLKKTSTFYIYRFVVMLGAPKSFIEKNKLPIYTPIKKRKRNVKKKSTNSR